MEETSWEKTDEQSGDSLIHIVQPQLKQHRAEMNSPCFPNYKFVSKINCGCYFIHLIWGQFQFSHSVMSDSLWPHEPSTPGLPVHHQLPESTQTHAHRVSDAIQPSHPLSSPSRPALNLSQHQGLFKWVSSSHRVAKVLELQVQHQSFQWIFRTDLL